MQRLKNTLVVVFVYVLDCVREARKPFTIFSAVKTIRRNETTGFKITSIVLCVLFLKIILHLPKKLNRF